MGKLTWTTTQNTVLVDGENEGSHSVFFWKNMQLNLFCSIFQNGVCSLENDPTNIDIGYVFLLASGNLFVCPKVIHFSRFGGCLCSAVFCRCTQTPAPTSHWPCGSLVFARLHDGEPGEVIHTKCSCTKRIHNRKDTKDGIHDPYWFASCMFTTGNHSKSWCPTSSV